MVLRVVGGFWCIQEHGELLLESLALLANDHPLEAINKEKDGIKLVSHLHKIFVFECVSELDP